MINRIIKAIIVFSYLFFLNPSYSDDNLKDGISAYESGEFKLAMTIFSPLAVEGNRSAQFYLGKMYDYGQGTIQDDLKALNWYQKAAKQGHPEAQFGVARMWDGGEGIPMRMELAWAWATIAAEQNVEKANILRETVEELMSENELSLARKEADRIRKEYVFPFRN